MVGKAYAEFFQRHAAYEVTGIDVNRIECDVRFTQGFSGMRVSDNQRVEEARRADLIVLCLPTEKQSDGSPDLTAIEWWLLKLSAHNGVVLIKSTVPPGFTQHWRDKTGVPLVHSPEFLGANRYYTPPHYLNPSEVHTHPFVILGGAPKDAEFVQQVMLPIVGPSCEFNFCSSTESEMVKYVVNSWGAMKVVMWGEYHDLCKAAGVNFANVRTLALKDKRIEPMHTAVFAEQKGYGSSHCFSKDMPALAHLAGQLGVPMEMVSAAMRKNGEWNQG